MLWNIVGSYVGNKIASNAAGGSGSGGRLTDTPYINDNTSPYRNLYQPMDMPTQGEPTPVLFNPKDEEGLTEEQKRAKRLEDARKAESEKFDWNKLGTDLTKSMASRSPLLTEINKYTNWF